MSKKTVKKVTFEQLIARKEQRDRDKEKYKDIYIPSMDATLLFKRISEDAVLDTIEGVGESRKKIAEASRKLIYMCCPTLQSKELQDKLGIIDQFDIVSMLFDYKESTEIGMELPTDIFVDEGYGDNYAHPHIRYTILDANGCHNYKIAGETMVECTLEDKAEELAARPKPEPADREIINAEILLSLAKQQQDLAALKESNTAIEETTAVLLLQIIGGEENV